jgi:uncharacterized membrane protein YedE/YeeE
MANRLCAVVASEEMEGGDYSFLFTFGVCALLCLILLPVLGITELIDISETQQLLPAGALIGGALFGYSAAFARGSVVGLLYRTGAGRLHALVAFAVMATSAAFAAEVFRLYPIPLVSRGWEIPNPASTAVPAFIPWTIATLALILLVAVTIIALRDREDASDKRPWLSTGFGIGILVLLAWLLSGDHGVSRGIEELPALERIASVLTSSQTKGSEWMAGIFIGIPVGAGLAAAVREKFNVRWPRFADPFESVLGGLGMGVGIALAGGGTLAYLYTGPGALIANSALFLAAMFPMIAIGRKQRERRREDSKKNRRKSKRRR